MRIRSFFNCAILVYTFLLLAACTTPSQPPLPEGNLRIGLAPFTQPTTMGQMLAGYQPENTPQVQEGVLQSLDQLFSTELAKSAKHPISGTAETKRVYAELTKDREFAQQAALRVWSAVGREMKVDLLVVPQLIFWQERTGSNYGATVPAGVILDVFVIDVNAETLLSRSHFEEIQEALADNLLNAGKFVRRGGKWVPAMELAQEAMQQAIKELAL